MLNYANKPLRHNIQRILINWALTWAVFLSRAAAFEAPIYSRGVWIALFSNVILACFDPNENHRRLLPTCLKDINIYDGENRAHWGQSTWCDRAITVGGHCRLCCGQHDEDLLIWKSRVVILGGELLRISEGHLAAFYLYFSIFQVTAGRKNDFSSMMKTWTHQCLTGCIWGGSEFLFFKKEFLFKLFRSALNLWKSPMTSYYWYFLHSRFGTDSPTYFPGQTAIKAPSDANVPKTSHLRTNSLMGFNQHCISAISSVKLHLSISIFEHCLAIVDMHVRACAWGSFINTPFLKLLTDRVKSVCVSLCVHSLTSTKHVNMCAYDMVCEQVCVCVCSQRTHTRLLLRCPLGSVCLNAEKWEPLYIMHPGSIISVRQNKPNRTVGGRTQEYIIPPRQTINPSTGPWMTPQSAPAHLLLFLWTAYMPFQIYSCSYLRGRPRIPKACLSSAHYPSAEGKGDSLWSHQFMKSEPGPLTTALPVRGRMVISGEHNCWMNEGQSVHQGVASKFHPGISGQAEPLDDIFRVHRGPCDAALQAFEMTNKWCV